MLQDDVITVEFPYSFYIVILANEEGANFRLKYLFKDFNPETVLAE